MAKMQTMNDLRNFLAEELERLKKEETTPAAVNASANAAGKIISTVKAECEYHKMRGTTPFISMMNTEEPQKKLETDK